MILSSPLQVWNRRALLSKEEMRRAEDIALGSGVRTSFQLMANAGHAAANIIDEKFSARFATVLCGTGNNGGDGYICAEELRRRGWDVVVARVGPPDAKATDAYRAERAYTGATIALADFVPSRKGVLIDALFGTGLNSEIGGEAQIAIEKIAHSSMPLVALDMPSGIDANTGKILGVAPRATMTVTFFRKKWGHLLRPAIDHCGEIVVVDIDLPSSVLEEVKPPVTENDVDVWAHVLPSLKADGHKYSRGHALLYGGPVMTGAARLAARAAQRIGAGMITLAASERVTRIYSEALESVIVRMVEKPEVWKELTDDPKRDAILIGPGLGVGQMEVDLIRMALASGKACVLDADVFSNFSDNPDDLIKRLHPTTVLTPHEGEFERLFGLKIDKTKDKLCRVKQAAQLTGAVVLLKGAETMIASPDGRVIINNNAPPWLATAGAGDVLSGIILGFVAQKMPPFAAAAAAAWAHGRIAAEFGPGLIAEDLVDGIPNVLKYFSTLH